MIQWEYDNLISKETKYFMEAVETPDAFIFRTISPFLEAHNCSYIEISKQDLIEAIRIINLRRQARATYGSATATDKMLHDAYIRGVQDGKDEMYEMYETMMSKFKEMEASNG